MREPVGLAAQRRAGDGTEPLPAQPRVAAGDPRPARANGTERSEAGSAGLCGAQHQQRYSEYTSHRPCGTLEGLSLRARPVRTPRAGSLSALTRMPWLVPCRGSKASPGWFPASLADHWVSLAPELRLAFDVLSERLESPASPRSSSSGARGSAPDSRRPPRRMSFGACLSPLPPASPESRRSRSGRWDQGRTRGTSCAEPTRSVRPDHVTARDRGPEARSEGLARDGTGRVVAVMLADLFDQLVLVVMCSYVRSLEGTHAAELNEHGNRTLRTWEPNPQTLTPYRFEQ